MVNGYTRTLVDFRALAKYLSERGFRVLTFDNRGAGKAECPPVFTLDEIGDDILSLWTHLKIEKSSLLGISYGGAIATLLAARVPERINKLMLVSVPVSEEYIAREMRGPAKDPRRFHLNMLHYFSKPFLTKNKLLVEGFIRQNMRTFQEPDTALGARAQRESMAELNLSEFLPKIKVPTLVMHGSEDYVVSKDSAKKISELIPNSQLEITPDIGHLYLAEAPLVLYRKASEFFS